MYKQKAKVKRSTRMLASIVDAHAPPRNQSAPLFHRRMELVLTNARTRSGLPPRTKRGSGRDFFRGSFDRVLAFSGTNFRNAAQPYVDERVGLFSAVEILPCRKSITTRWLVRVISAARIRKAPWSHKFPIASSRRCGSDATRVV